MIHLILFIISIAIVIQAHLIADMSKRLQDAEKEIYALDTLVLKYMAKVMKLEGK
jgi:hypothetical protein